MFRVALCWALSGLAVAGACGRASDAGERAPLRIAAAASLVPVFEELGQAFTERSGRPIAITSGSSGKLAAQIAEGAPFDLFASADAAHVDAVIAEDAGVADSRTLYAHGRLVAWTPPGVAPPSSLRDLASPRFRTIALANPEYAPYGHAAVQALRAAGVWSDVEDRVVYGAHVGQALQFGESGNADVVLTSLSLVRDAPGRYLLIDDSLHGPLEHVAVIVARASDPAAARELLELLGAPESVALLARHGLARPGHSAPAP